MNIPQLSSRKRLSFKKKHAFIAIAFAATLTVLGGTTPLILKTLAPSA